MVLPNAHLALYGWLAGSRGGASRPDGILGAERARRANRVLLGEDGPAWGQLRMAAGGPITVAVVSP